MPSFSAAQLLAITVELALMLVLPATIVVLWCRHRIRLTVPVVAAGCYLLSLVVSTPLVQLLYPRLANNWIVLTALTALTYGVCEESARWLSFRTRALRTHRDGDGAIAAGLGHGGAEAACFGLPYLIGTLALVLAPAAVPEAVRAQTFGASPWLFLGTGLDRLPAMACHLVFALLIVLAYQRGRRFLGLAILAHAALDFTIFALQHIAPAAVWIPVWAAAGIAAVLTVRRLYRMANRNSGGQQHGKGGGVGIALGIDTDLVH